VRALRSLSLALCAALLLPYDTARADAPSPGLHLAPCTQGRAHVRAECGTYGVYEDRAARAGRIVPLRIVVLKATHPTGRAIAWITGGPGESAVADAPQIADGAFEKAVHALRERYDVVFVDNRGMGASNPSHCDIAPRSDPAAYFTQLFPDAIVHACRLAYAKKAELNHYNTNNAVDDLDDVRAALGYRKVVLFGGSYGTFFSFVFMRRHPEHVESAVLQGVDAPHFQSIPGSPDGAQTALDDLIAKCGNDALCRARFPRFAEHFAALVRRFDDGPIPVRVTNPATKRVQTVRLAKEVFVDHLRQVLYDPEGAAYVPFVVEQAYRGDTVPLGKMIDVAARGIAGALDDGAYLSYSCADFMPFVSPAQVAAVASRSFTGDLRVRAQRRACAIWNVRPSPPSFDAIVRSDVPTLILSGSDDPATPPRYAAQALPYLRNGRQVLVRGAGHAMETLCTDRLITAFVRAGSAKGLDVSRCTAAFIPPRFATSMKGWREL
jgi:pimeloyl-ACP methyl ester carboxylesterase